MTQHYAAHLSPGHMTAEGATNWIGYLPAHCPDRCRPALPRLGAAYLRVSPRSVTVFDGSLKLASKLLIFWCPQRDSNPCYRRERAMS